MAASLRHIAIVVRDLEKAARFYESVFGLKRVGRDDLEFASGIYLSDGVVNLALLNYKQGSKGSGLTDAASFVGAHHFGFVVDDLKETQAKIEANGGSFYFDLGSEDKENFERKFKDPDGVIFDVSRKGWVGTDRRHN
jgi:catechol 2,3-dioxygenase-like lactoylglutathione lyase family enzyme